jgi:hypothetical protein
MYCFILVMKISALAAKKEFNAKVIAGVKGQECHKKYHELKVQMDYFEFHLELPSLGILN